MSFDINRLFGASNADFDLQAGGLGLSTTDIVDSYLESPGHVLAILRLYSKRSREEVSAATGLTVQMLIGYETGAQAPSLPDLTAFAHCYDCDLRFLLEAFGHVTADSTPSGLGIAADFDGELTHDEKVDLKELVRSFANRDSSDDG